MVLVDLKRVYNNVVFHKTAMIKNSLDNYYGSYEHNIVEDNNNYFIIEMTPKPFTNGLNKMSIKFDIIQSKVYNHLNKIYNISLIN